jgi:hypothetical protein
MDLVGDVNAVRIKAMFPDFVPGKYIYNKKVG